MPRLLSCTGVNFPGETPVHFGAITGGSQIRAWAINSGSISINQSRFRLINPTTIAITSTHQPSGSASQNTPLMAIGTKSGLIHIISLTSGELLKTIRQTASTTDKLSHKDQDKGVAVADLAWSKDGQTLYSLSKRFVFQWNIGSTSLIQHKRFNIFAQLTAFLAENQALLDPTIAPLLTTSSESLRHLTLNHNQDKLILAGRSAVYVYCLRTNTVLAKYYGFLGYPVSICVDTPLSQYEHQVHHNMVQSQFAQGDLANNDTTRTAAEFFISVATDQGSSVSIYSYPPAFVAPSEKIVMKRRVKAPTTSTATPAVEITKKGSKKTALSAQEEEEEEDTFITTLFQISSRETARCTLPADAQNLTLSIIYDKVSQIIPTNTKSPPSQLQHLYPPIALGTRPHLLLTASTLQGNICAFDIPSRVDVQEAEAKSKKAAPKLTHLPTTLLPTSSVLIHDPTITNAHNVLEAGEDTTNKLEAQKALIKNKVSNSTQRLIGPAILQEGAIVAAAFVDLGKMYIIRNSSIRPALEMVKLCTKELSQDAINRFVNIPRVQNVPQQAFDFGANADKLIKHWNKVITVNKYIVNANVDFQSAQESQSVTAADAIKAANAVGGKNVIVPGAKANSSSTHVFASATSQRVEGEDLQSFEKRIGDKRQRLLNHVSKLNTSLQHILEQNQTSHAPLTLTQNNSVSMAQTFAQFSQLQGTLCGVLVQALRSGDDQSIEHTIKFGVQGLNSQAGWTSLTKYLNNPEALLQWEYQDAQSKEQPQADGKDVMASLQNSSKKIPKLPKHLTRPGPNDIQTMSNVNNVISFKQLAAGKTLVQTARLLPQQFVIPFLTTLSRKLTANPLRAFELLPWIHVILRLHSMYLLSVPSVHNILGQVSNVLKQRTTTLNNVVQLKGRLEVILTQFNNSQVKLRQGMAEKSKELPNGFIPSHVYNEQHELERGFFGLGSVDNEVDDGEDDVDMFDTKPNPKKRKSPSVDNFKAMNFNMDMAMEDDDDEPLDNDEMFMGFGEDGYEGEFDMSVFANEGEDDMFNEMGMADDAKSDFDDFDEDDFELDDDDL